MNDQNQQATSEVTEQKRMIFAGRLPSVDDLVDLALNAACLAVQQAVGQTDGGLAGVMFSGSDFSDLFRPYCMAELDDAESRRSEERTVGATMEMPAGVSVSVPEIVYGDSTYVDCAIYIKDLVTGEEWKFTLSKDLSSGDFYRNDEFAESAEDGFDETSRDVPDLIEQAYEQIKPAGVNAIAAYLLKQEQAKALGFRTIAEMDDHEQWLRKHGTPEYRAWVARIPTP